LPSTLPPHIVLTRSILAIVLHCLSFANQVGVARRKHKVAYPNMVAEAGKSFGMEEDGTTPHVLNEVDAEEFNRYQRIHQNNNENLATFYLLELIAGLSFPVPAAVFGGVWILGRQLYSEGYKRSVKTRMWGAIHYVGSLGLICLCLSFGVYLQQKKAPY
jgi:hypothetical protein